MLNRATRFASTTWSIPIEDLELSLEEMVGGFESRVVRAIFRSRVAKDWRPRSFVVKELRGLQRRETNIYRELWTRSTAPPTVRLLGTETAEDADYLYLEEATPQSEWPWNQTFTSAAVCQALARLHDNEQWRQSLRMKHLLLHWTHATRRVFVTGGGLGICVGLSARYLKIRLALLEATTFILYWYASASNGLSGAIRYHLLVLIDPACSSEMKSDSARILHSWERVIRRVTEALGESSSD
jgi:hypothetical protein